MPRLNDTIAALSTPAGTAALAVIRISGPDTLRLTAEVGGGAPLPRVARRVGAGARASDSTMWWPHVFTARTVTPVRTRWKFPVMGILSSRSRFSRISWLAAAGRPDRVNLRSAHS